MGNVSKVVKAAAQVFGKYIVMAKWGIRLVGSFPKEAVATMFEKAQKEAVNSLAIWLHQRLLDTIDSGRSEWPPLSKVTEWLKGSNVALIDSGDFRKAIQYEINGKVASIGILNPVGDHGQDMELIARVIEGGAVIPVTEKMRGWFAAKGFPLKSTTVAIHVPARSVFGVNLSALDDKIEEVLGSLVDKSLGVLRGRA